MLAGQLTMPIELTQAVSSGSAKRPHTFIDPAPSRSNPPDKELDY